MRITLLVALALLSGCSFFVPAYKNPDSKTYEKQKEKARRDLHQEGAHWETNSAVSVPSAEK